MDPTLNIYYQNCRGLRSKVNDSFHNISISDHNIICLTETWLNHSISSEEVFHNKYEVFRRDRSDSASEKKDGGGVAIAINKDFLAQQHGDMQSDAEDLWVSIESEKRDKIFICCVYLPPGDTVAYYSFLSKLRINHLNVFNKYPVIVLGDFNFSSVGWVNVGDEQYLEPINVDGKYSELIDIFSFSELVQYNNIPNSNNKMLDLVLSNRNFINKVAHSIDPIVPEDSHHPALEVIFEPIQIKTIKYKKMERFNFHKANYVEINNILSNTSWARKFDNYDINSTVNIFYEVINNTIAMHVPKYKVKGDYPIYFQLDTIKTIKQKIKAHKKYKIYGGQLNYETFSNLRRHCKHLMQRDYREYLKNVESEISVNSKNFWKFIKNKHKSSTNIPEKMTYENLTANNGDEVCNLFSDYFKSVYVPSLNGEDIFDINVDLENQIVIEKDQIIRVIDNLDCQKGPGPDNIPVVYIKNCKENLVEPLASIFNGSLQEGCFPNKWKSSFIIPLHKGGDRRNVKNYRPISKLSVFGKIFEKIIHSIILDCVKNTIIKQQHGFFPCRSIDTNLVTFTEFVVESMDDRTQVDVVYTDFSKAFDKISHPLLMVQLAEVGVCAFLRRWVWSYISGRTQSVVVNGFSSDQFSVTSGVPQGSHLGPLLFIIYINNIINCIKNSNFLLYADDLKIFCKIRNLDDCRRLQCDLDSLADYCRNSSLFLNLDKCVAISFTRNKNVYEYNYTLDTNTLKSVQEIRDLGVLMDSKMIFDLHSEKIINSCNRMLGFILRNGRNFENPKTLLSLYYAFVYSRLNFASVVWNPQYVIYQRRLESVQNKFLRCIAKKLKLHIIDSNYNPILNQFSMLTLVTRRKVSDLVMFYKIITNKLQCNEVLEKIILNNRVRELRHSEMYATPFRNTNSGQNSPVCRMIKTFNTYCDNGEIFEMSLPRFKRYAKNLFSN